MSVVIMVVFVVFGFNLFINLSWVVRFVGFGVVVFCEYEVWIF